MYTVWKKKKFLVSGLVISCGIIEVTAALRIVKHYALRIYSYQFKKSKGSIETAKFIYFRDNNLGDLE